MGTTTELDARALARELAGAVRGEVRFSPGSRALYANDASVHRQVPIGVVIPRSASDVVTAVEICRRFGAPIGARGCGTGLAGQTVNQAVMLDFSKYMHEIVELDPERRFARVQPGLVLDRLRDAAEEHGLTFGPDPATHSRCTLGGMIGNNSCGTHSIMAGVTADNIESLDVLLYDGTRLTLPSLVDDDELSRVVEEGGRVGDIYARLRDLRGRYADLIRERYPQIPRRISGYNLDRLLPEHGFNLAAAMVGTEATCALVLEARCKLIPSPQCRSLVLVGYEDGATAADQVPEVMGYGPIGLEMFDRRLVRNEEILGRKRRTDLLPDGDAWLLVEFGADSEDEVDEQAERFTAAVRSGGAGGPSLGVKLYEDSEEIAQVWEIREGGVGHSKIPGQHPGWPSWEDAAVAPERIGDYLRDLEALCDKHGRRVSCLFGHVGHGCVHSRIDWDFLTSEGLRNYRAFMEEAGDLIASYGGSLSGEHGDGQARAELLPKMFGSELIEAFREFKAIWDPRGRMNPGKVVDPYPITSNLRLGPAYQPPQPDIWFGFPEDEGSFSKATRRCVGVGSCRRRDSDKSVMCPSYMATNEEKYSTRGRARLLFEMMEGGPVADMWRSAEVEEALALCFGCKGCKSDCPVNTDMATYKAEFRAHHYKGRLRPRAAYSMGLIRDWSRIAGRVPWLANVALQTPGLSGIAKAIGGIARERRIPRYADEPFTQWFARSRRPPADGDKRRKVMLWPDTFNTYFRPRTAIAATKVLESLGYTVVLPPRPLCCGRPLYDWGMLDKARGLWTETIAALEPALREGMPIVGLEPACVSAFRDELPNLMHGNELAQMLAGQVKLFSEFLEHDCHDAALPKIEQEALVHVHCHH
ncbi:MAG TPA: FAD-binding and (Fe-S)-binding domain-containing protein, partial [Solirubrobacteraceae bacterium]|nr:FAD-binding and (Fe-S)-binding domain-containing protein [Solirubrobacteraceae bacterium]